MKCLPSWIQNEVSLGCDCSRRWIVEMVGEKILWGFCWFVCKIKQSVPWRLWGSGKILYLENIAIKKKRVEAKF